MTKYRVEKRKKYARIMFLYPVVGYTFKPKLSNHAFIQVQEVNIIDKEFIDRILTMKIEKAFKRLIKIAMHILEDEDTSDTSAIRIALDEAELVREILLNRYQKFLNQEKEELFLKKLRLIENELRMKEVKIKQKAIYLERQEERTMGRSR